MKLVKVKILKTCFETGREGIEAGKTYTAEVHDHGKIYIGNCVFWPESYEIIK